uniref:Ion_trans_2 domain-containing protein n=1 Tax=Elaeophora elaphi TaxID=1147741 RepID=A0A0R3S527_9BILA
MSVLLTGNCNISSSSYACINPNVDNRTAITSLRSETLLRSVSVTSCKSCGDGGNDKLHSSNRPSMSVMRETSVAFDNETTKDADKIVTPVIVSDLWLKRIKRSYKFLHLNYLFSLVFMMIYMFIGALLFLWLEGASDRARKLHEYKFYIHERELFFEQLDEIYNVGASKQRKLLLKKAVDYLHQQIGVSFTNRSDWSLTTALYYSGTVLTTIGLSFGNSLRFFFLFLND